MVCIVGGDDQYPEVQNETSLFAEQGNKIVNCKSQLSLYIYALYGYQYQLTEILPKVKAMRHFLLFLHNCICANAQGAHAKNHFMFSVPLRKVLLAAREELVSLLIAVSPLRKVLWAAPFDSPISAVGMCWIECVPAGPWGKVAEGRRQIREQFHLHVQ